jgi:serine/threonine protein kinase
MEKIDQIGYGAYGNTYSVVLNGKLYALKQNIKQNHVLGSPVIRELSTLILLKGNPNIVDLCEVHLEKPTKSIPDIKNDTEVEDKIFFLFELANFDLYSYIYVLNSPVKHILKIMADIALGLEVMHKNSIIHRDIKPGNILISVNGIPYNKLNKQNKNVFTALINDKDSMSISAKICDFGFSKCMTKNRRSATPGVVTLWYRSPEIIMQREHDEKTDVWSYGLLVYEMLFSEALYSITSDTDEDELKNAIIRKRPEFTEEDSKYFGLHDKFVPCGGPLYRCNYFDISHIDANRKRRIETLTGDLQVFEDFFRSVLQINPDNRPSITEVLNSPLFDTLKDYIKKARETEIMIPKTTFRIVSNPYREKGFSIFRKLHKMLIETGKVKPEILFLAIDIYDRYLIIKKYIDIVDELLLIIVISCFYIAYKYHNSFITKPGIQFITEVLGITENDLFRQNVENMELDILVNVEYQVYYETIYSLIDPSISDNSLGILDLMEKLPNDVDIDPREMASNYSTCYES